MKNTIMKNTIMTYDSMNLSPHQRLLARLGSAGVYYALIREPEHWDDSGDIDILVQDIEELSAVFESWGCFEYSSSNSNKKYLKLDAGTGWWSHIDVLSNICFGEISAPAGFVDTLLDAAKTGNDGVCRLHPHDEIILLIFHAALDKGKFSKKYMRRFLGVDMDKLCEQSSLYKFLPWPLEAYIKLINEMKRGVITDEDVVKQIMVSFNYCGSSSTPMLSRAARRLKGLMQGNRGIVFLGPDGAGKSTITESLSGLRWPKIRLQFMGPGREAAMKPLFTSVLSLFGNLREKYPKGNLVGLFVRGAWQIICYIDFLERLYRHTWFWGSGGVVFFDRYACDMYFRKPTWLNEKLFISLFPKPNFVFLCTGDAAKIHHRKPELTISEIESTIDLYRKKLSQHRIPFKEIDTTSNTPNKNIDQVVSHLIVKGWFVK
jgi:hypothetical protein